MTFPSLPLGAYAIISLLLSSCGGSDPDRPNAPGHGVFIEETRTTTEIAVELLFQEQARVVIHENANAPVSVGHIRPIASEFTELRELPSLLMTPPSEVQITIPTSSSSRALQLHANFGIDSKSCETNPKGQEHLIGFEVLLNGDRVLRDSIRLRGPYIQQVNWIEIVDENGAPFVLSAGDDLTLRTHVVSTPPMDWLATEDDLPKVGFGRLQLREYVEAPIELASAGLPNILLVVMDTLRADRTSLGGNSALTTPFLDGLATEGTSYGQARATSSWTWPSTASLLTGRLPAGHGVQESGSSYMHGEIDTLAEIMQRRGLATGGFVGNRLVSSNFNFDQGFQTFFDPQANEFVAGSEIIPIAKRWITDHKDERFFAYVHLIEPHHPYRPRPESLAALPHDEPEGYQHRNLHQSWVDLWLESNDGMSDRPLLHASLPAEDLAWIQASYNQVVHTGDMYLGDLLQHLEDEGLRKNTLIIFTADHGEEFYDHGYSNHGQSLYPELTHVPLVFNGPGIPVGVAIDEPVSNRLVFDYLRDVAIGDAGKGAPIERPGAPVFFSTHRGNWNGVPMTEVLGVQHDGWVLHFAPEGTPWGSDPEMVHEGGVMRLYELASDPLQHTDVSLANLEKTAVLKDLLLKRLAASAKLRPSMSGLDAGDGTIEMLQDVGYL
jgi:arylsulfatase A-like enzyme